MTPTEPAIQPRLTIHITIDNVRYETHERYVTGAQLLAMAGLPSGDQLFREVAGHGDDEPIAADQVVGLHDGEKFYAVPVGNFG